MNLKFRAWDEQFQSMSEVIDIDYRRECIELSHFDGDEYPIIQDFNKTKLMQSTGLTDKNGKEIFEGDIVRVDGFKNIVVKFGKIEHQENDGGVAIYQGFNLLIGGGYPEAVMSDFEIVGNVFENIHLL
ncbi:hypothetical protein PQE87_gp56 [Streptococcus phage CHPC1042]|uniref:YopX protein domain-containing protein n=1 Tax=Streptococcus phage CHPC1042 TaxID=2365016 RepID=A0A3G8F9Y0_9CAUD|nr:hypothetical protein PQE87_gp56 [Streptococcus phage CHPC1042]AXF53516.1 putative YopX protein [Streptococcus phage 93]AZF91565.1 hypothetical protein CHPC1042_0056 [Streptococcus phage CHPC1042]